MPAVRIRHRHRHSPAFSLLGALLLVAALAAPSASARPVRDHAPTGPGGLLVAGQRDPLAVQDAPQFSWLPRDADADEIQSAYELRVTTADHRPVWDSGQVSSTQQSWVPYAGPALQPATSYVWSVRTWDRGGLASPYAAARFDSGLGDQDWSGAQWIKRITTGNDATNEYTLARRTLDVPRGSPVVRARAYVAAMGNWELHVNGRTVDKTSSPGYPGEGYYDVSDLTALARAGRPLTVGVLYHYWSCKCQGRANGPVSPEGPSGLLVKVVIDHADGTSNVLVSDGSWKLTQDAAQSISTVTYRNSDSGDRIEYVDARKALSGWATPTYDDSAWVAAAVIGPHPRPAAASCTSFEGGSSPCVFTHLVAQQAHLSTRIVHPESVQRLPDGAVLADFGQVYSAVPSLQLTDGAAGRALTLTTSYRENNTTTTAATPRGAATVALAAVSNLHVGDTITVDAPADGYGPGNPETRTVTSVATGSATLNRALRQPHANGVWVENSRVGTSKLDTQGSNMHFYYTETNGSQIAEPLNYWAWRYLEISDPGEKLTAHDISAVVQNTDVPDGHAATFSSSSSTLDSVFSLMQRSALQSEQDTFLDTPTREKGQFLGDTVDESYASMSALDERLLTRQAIVDFIGSQNRYWTNGAMNAVYPNGDAKRDIPDYTEMFPDWVMRYYQLSGDHALLAQAYPAMKRVADYIDSAVNSTGLVYQLPGGSGPYQYGIIDWPADMRYDTVVDGNGAELVVNALAVGANDAVAAAATALGQQPDAETYTQHSAALKVAANANLQNPATRLYSDGLATTTLAPIDNYSQHAQTYAIDYGIAASADYRALGDAIAADGMKQGPMDLRQLESALGKTGQSAALVSLLTDPSHPGPAQILAEGATFMWENWNPGCKVAGCTGSAVSQTDNTSFSHGWGSAGVNGVLESLLGITVSGVGASSVLVQPPVSGLSHAAGTEWTERGPVSVRWQLFGHILTADVSVPVNVAATVVLGGTHFTVGSGRHHLVGFVGK